MTVEITAQPIAALRAQLSGHVAEHKRLIKEFSDRDDRVAYSALVHAAFMEAVSRRFTRQSTASDVVEYVADVRSRADEIANAVDPRVGERLILEVLGKGTTYDIDTRTSSTAMLFILTALVADEEHNNATLEQFIAKAKKTADYLLNSDA
jgi:hypothetical protein